MSSLCCAFDSSNDIIFLCMFLCLDENEELSVVVAISSFVSNYLNYEKKKQKVIRYL